jgi:hypothetical protein
MAMYGRSKMSSNSSKEQKMQKFNIPYYFYDQGRLLNGLKSINGYPVDLPFNVKGFVYRDGKQWFVREISTGLTVGYGKYLNKEDAIKGVKDEFIRLGAYVVLCVIAGKKKLNIFS